MKRLGPENPHEPLEAYVALRMAGEPFGPEMVRDTETDDWFDPDRFQWVEQDVEPLEGTPAAPPGQHRTYRGITTALLVRPAQEGGNSPEVRAEQRRLWKRRVKEGAQLQRTPASPESVQAALEILDLAHIPARAVLSEPLWNLGLGRRLAHLTPEALEVMVRLADETSDMGRLVEIAEGVTR